MGPMPPLRQLLTLRRLVALACALAIVGTATWLVVGAGVTSVGALARELDGFIDGLPPWLRAAALLPIAVACLVCLIPSPVVIAVSGLLLGATTGFVVAILAIGVAVLAERWIAGTLVGQALHARFARRHPEAEERISALGFPGVLLMRALGTPTTVIGWASSATGLRAWQVSAGCMVGSMPRAVAYVTLGATGASLVRPAEWTWQVWSASALLVALLVVSLALGWRRARRARSTRRR